MSNCLWHQGLPHDKLFCPSLSLEFPQTHVHWFSDDIQPSQPLSLPSLPSLHFPQHQGFFFPVSQPFTLGGQSIGASAAASVLPMNIQSWYLLGLTGLISLLSKGHSRVLSSSTIWRHQFFRTQPFIWSNFHIHTWLMEKPYFWLYGPLLAKWCLCFLICCLG